MYCHIHVKYKKRRSRQALSATTRIVTSHTTVHLSPWHMGTQAREAAECCALHLYHCPYSEESRREICQLYACKTQLPFKDLVGQMEYFIFS